MGDELPILKGILNGQLVNYHNARRCHLDTQATRQALTFIRAIEIG